MDYFALKHLTSHPAVDLLRSDYAAMILGFLFRVFKAHHRAIIPESQIRALLESYLDELREQEPERYEMSAAQYLALWCDDAHQYLRKYLLDDAEEPVFELTSGSEKAMLWMEQLSGTTGFVGTESRLDSIFKGLDDILRNTTTELSEKIRQLEEDAERIQTQIHQLRVLGKVTEVYTPVQVNERFAQILTTSRELLSDFRLVEDNLKRIAQTIAEEHAKPGATKGSILGKMLDAEEALRRSEQGQSFYAFWALLLSGRQREFQTALERVLELEQLNEKLKSSSLKNLIQLLLLEGKKVLEASERMATNLRRVLDARRAADRARVHELVQEIQSIAIHLRTSPPSQPVFYIEEFVDFFSAMSRPLYSSPPALPELGNIEVADSTITKDELKEFANLPHINLNQMRKNVGSLLEKHQAQTLEEVLDRYPPKNGMIEVLGYMILAMENPHHFVSDDDQVITVPGPKPQKWRVPRVLFCR